MSDDTHIQLTTGIVAAYVGSNDVSPEDLPILIRSVHAALGALGAPEEAAAPAIKLTPAQIRRSITPDALISFEDSKPYKQLKRHLTTRGMTPADYRAKWGLPKDYPMVAATYTAIRSALAKAAGLGQKAAAVAVPKPPENPPAKLRPKGRLSLFGKRRTGG